MYLGLVCVQKSISFYIKVTILARAGLYATFLSFAWKSVMVFIALRLLSVGHNHYELTQLSFHHCDFVRNLVWFTCAPTLKLVLGHGLDRPPHGVSMHTGVDAVGADPLLFNTLGLNLSIPLLFIN